MKLLLTILIGIAVLTFSWGWLMNVHYGHMTTDKYVYHYLAQTKWLLDEGVQKIRELVRFLSNFSQPIERPQLKGLTG